MVGRYQSTPKQSHLVAVTRIFKYLKGTMTYGLWYPRNQNFAGIFISQEKYLKEMLKKFQMEDSSTVNTPMVVGCKLSKDDISSDVDQRSYLSMIGSLLYIIASHPDIIQVVGMVGRYQSTPKQSHLVAVTRIFKYFKGIILIVCGIPEIRIFS